MAMVSVDQSDPKSSAEFVAVDARLQGLVQERHQKAAEFMAQRGLAGLLIQTPANLSWLTGGAEMQVGFSNEPAAALFLTAESRVVVCNNVSSPRIFESLVAGLGFQLKQRSWCEPREKLLLDLCRGRQVGCDCDFPGTVNVGDALQHLRWPLDERAQEDLHQAARVVGHALEACARSLEPGRTEAEIAGEIAHRLIKHQVEPVRVQVLADGRGQRFRDWSYSPSEVGHQITLLAVGRYRGLHAGVARTVCFDTPSEEFLRSYRRAALVMATALFYTQAGATVGQLLARVKRTYEKVQAPEEWQLAPQGSICEYAVDAVRITPNDATVVVPGTPVFWHPSVESAMMGETVIVREEGLKLLSYGSGWPVLKATVAGSEVDVPDILLR